MVAEEAERRLCVWDAVAALCGSLIGAFVLICLDAVLDGCYLTSLLVCPVWFIVSVVKSLVQRPKPLIASARAAVPLVTLLLVLGNYYVQRSVANANAANLIRACESYREANGTYPERLEQLVPRYVASIPRAKYCCLHGEFWYLYGRDFECHILLWYDIPPFGRKTYNLDSRRWGYLD
jgi:hypothetical protein